MLNRFRLLRAEYPAQYWLLFFGLLISFMGASFVWPYLLLYIGKTLTLPIYSITWLLTLNLGMGLISSFIAGPITDRFGRKWVMVVSLLANGLVYLLYSQAQTLLVFAIVSVLAGMVSPLYKVSANAMVSDMMCEEKRAEAFALMRLSNNLAVVLGPPIGGFLVFRSYDLAFFGAAAGMIVYGVLVIFFGHETLPNRDEKLSQNYESSLGYKKALQDRHFLSMVTSLTLTYLCAGIMWTLLGVYTITEHNLLERDYGWIPMTNALMVVFLQVLVTSFTKQYPPLLMMAVGSFFFAIGVGSVAVGEKFWAFWTSMVVMSIGELIVVPTADSYVSRLAPVDMRGRYMSIAALPWSIGNGLGPLIGGYISEALNSEAIWYGAFTLGIGGTMGFMLMEARKRITGCSTQQWWKEAHGQNRFHSRK